MRRLTAALLAPLAVTAALAGCSSSGPSHPAGDSVRVPGPEGKAPAIKIPAQKAGRALVTKTLVSGHGPKLTAGESYLANLDVYLVRSKRQKLLFPTFTTQPYELP